MTATSARPMGAGLGAPRGAVRVRAARPTDNESLVALALACPMEGDVGLCVSRAPDFFALNRLEGESSSAVAEEVGSGAAVGCAAVARRRVWLHGSPADVMYAYDLKVHPAHRGGPAADALSRWVRDECERRGGPGVPVFLTILAGNAPMERRTTGRVASVPRFARFATVRSHSITLLGARRLSGERTGLRVERARAEDVEEMAALWDVVARTRQLAPLLDAESLARLAAEAPGLGIESYRVARRRDDGRIAGFAAFWDQSSFKQLRVTRYSPRLAAVRLAFNALGPLFAAAPLPPAGGALRQATAFNVCVPADEPTVLRALVRDAHDDLRAAGFSVLTVGLDVRDPLAAALHGLFAQPTDVHAYACTATGDYAGPALDERVLHHEIALV